MFWFVTFIIIFCTTIVGAIWYMEVVYKRFTYEQRIMFKVCVYMSAATWKTMPFKIYLYFKD